MIDNLSDQSDLLNRALILDRNFTLFHTYTSYYDNVISQNVIRELEPIEIRTVVRPFIKSIEQDAVKSGIEIIEPEFNGFHVYTIPMHPSEWSSILFNFYTNSKKAMLLVENDRKLLIEAGFEGNIVYLEFSDTGIGIPEGKEEEIFNEFFTTSNQSNFNNDENLVHTGTGLGLKIVQDIISSYRGKIFVASPKGEFKTCIRIEVPKANDKQLANYGL